MSPLMTALTILTLSICAEQKNIIKEDLTVEKPTSPTTQQKVIYKKVPTRWVKITKKSN